MSCCDKTNWNTSEPRVRFKKVQPLALFVIGSVFLVTDSLTQLLSCKGYISVKQRLRTMNCECRGRKHSCWMDC